MKKQTGIRKAMLLAAGLGTRLLPITEKTPKPLVPVLNAANVLYGLFLLKRSGIEEVVLNLHHLPEAIETALGDGSKFGLKIHYSREQLLLGTGGGLKKAQPFFGKEPLVLVNCDFITNTDLLPFIEKHRAQKSLATMLLWENAQAQAFYSKVGVDGEGHLCTLPLLSTGTPARTGIFTGIHILENKAFDYLEEVPSGINQVLYPQLMKDEPERVFGFFLDKAYWYDTGELRTLWSTSIKLLTALKNGEGLLREFMKTFGGYEEKRPGVWAPTSVTLPKEAVFHGPAVIGENCTIGPRTVIGPYAVLGDNSAVAEEAQLTRFVGLAGSKIAAYQASECALLYEDRLIPMDKSLKA